MWWKSQQPRSGKTFRAKSDNLNACKKKSGLLCLLDEGPRTCNINCDDWSIAPFTVLSAVRAGTAEMTICTYKYNVNQKFRGPSLKPLLPTNLSSSRSVYSYQRDERVKPGNLLTKRYSLLPPHNSIMSHTYPRNFHSHLLFYYFSLSLFPRETPILFCLPDCWLEITTGHLETGFLAFPLSVGKRWDGSQV